MRELRTALEAGGVEFMDNGNGPVVKLRKANRWHWSTVLTLAWRTWPQIAHDRR